MSFQVLDNKGQNFLELVNDKNNPLELTYFKGGIRLKYFGYLNSLCTRATKAIINHIPIDEY